MGHWEQVGISNRKRLARRAALGAIARRTLQAAGLIPLALGAAIWLAMLAATWNAWFGG